MKLEVREATLDYLVKKAILAGVGSIALRTSPQGLSVYQKYGFVVSGEEMFYPFVLIQQQKKSLP